MIDTIKELVGLDPISSLESKSSKIMDVFTSTIKDLTKVNDQAHNEIMSREEEITRLRQESASIAAIRQGNLKVIEKLNKLFE